MIGQTMDHSFIVGSLKGSDSRQAIVRPRSYVMSEKVIYPANSHEIDQIELELA